MTENQNEKVDPDDREPATEPVPEPSTGRPFPKREDEGDDGRDKRDGPPAPERGDAQDDGGDPKADSPDVDDGGK